MEYTYKNAILLYSDYSPNSNKILNFINEKNIELENLTYLRVDDNRIRDLILKDKQFEIKTVPCLLIFYQNGIVEKYDNTEELSKLLSYHIKQTEEIVENTQVEINNPILEKEHFQQIKDIEVKTEDIPDISLENEDENKDEIVINKKQNSDGDPYGTIALAKQMAQSREDLDSVIKKQNTNILSSRS
jgi:hypothetical protein